MPSGGAEDSRPQVRMTEDNQVSRRRDTLVSLFVAFAPSRIPVCLGHILLLLLFVAYEMLPGARIELSSGQKGMGSVRKTVSGNSVRASSIFKKQFCVNKSTSSMEFARINGGASKNIPIELNINIMVSGNLNLWLGGHFCMKWSITTLPPLNIRLIGPDSRDLLRWMHLILTHMGALFKFISFINQLYSWPSIAGAYPTIFTVICVISPPPLGCVGKRLPSQDQDNKTYSRQFKAEEKQKREAK